MSADAAPLLSLRGVCKAYGAVVALSDIDLDIHGGEILAICGDNGAGKSTLIRLISGADMPSAGRLAMRGRPIAFASPRAALAAGVSTIYQDLALAPRLSIAANVFMGAELTRGLPVPGLRVLDHRRMAAEARRYLAQLGIAIADTTRPVEGLSGGQRQAVAIARALRWNAELVVMDEPTAALGVRESALVLDLVRRLKSDGRTVLLVSHNMRDVASLADRVVILGGGRKRLDRPAAGLVAEDLAALIMRAPVETG
jgi:simple sugar transport system ATP-binding protein